MKFILIFLFVFINVIICTAQDTTYGTTYYGDPQPTGGAPCDTDSDCGGINGGQCISYSDSITVDGKTGYCECYNDRADPDCTYQRKSKDLAGGLQFICFAGIGGVGDFYLGNNGVAAGQLVLMLSYLAIIVLGCVALCCFIADNSVTDICGGAVLGVGGCILCCTTFAGFIWTIVRAAQMFSGDITDGNGYALY